MIDEIVGTLIAEGLRALRLWKVDKNTDNKLEEVETKIIGVEDQLADLGISQEEQQFFVEAIQFYVDTNFVGMSQINERLDLIEEIVGGQRDAARQRRGGLRMFAESREYKSPRVLQAIAEMEAVDELESDLNDHPD